VSDAIEITAGEFASLVRPLIPLAGTDRMLPLLNTIHFESADKYLVGMATDRFRLGINRVAPAAVPAGLSFSLGLATIRAILSVFKATRFADPSLQMTVEQDRVRLVQTGGLDFMDASVTYPLVDGEFPRLRKVIADAIEAEPTAIPAGVGYNAGYMADFRHAVDRSTPLVLRAPSDASPTVVMAGDDFIGAIMPVRHPAEQSADAFKGWAAFLSPTPATAPKKRASRAKTKEVA
jgi:hypothetical protein